MVNKSLTSRNRVHVQPKENYLFPISLQAYFHFIGSRGSIHLFKQYKSSLYRGIWSQISLVSFFVICAVKRIACSFSLQDLLGNMFYQSGAGKMPCGRGSVCSKERGVRKGRKLTCTYKTTFLLNCVSLLVKYLFNVFFLFQETIVIWNWLVSWAWGNLQGMKHSPKHSMYF